VTPWQVFFTKQAQKDGRRLDSAGLRRKAEELLTILAIDPFRKPPPFEKLRGVCMAHIPAALIFNTAWCIKSSKTNASSRSFACGPMTSRPWKEISPKVFCSRDCRSNRQILHAGYGRIDGEC